MVRCQIIKRCVLGFLLALSSVTLVGQERGAWVMVSRHPDASVYCTYSVSPTSSSFSNGATTQAYTITTTSGCTWTATSNAVWVSITSGSSGTGSGTTNTSISANSGSSRTSSLVIAGQTIPISQSSGSAACSTGTSAAVVPCAFGYGMSTRAAYGSGASPTIYRVTSLSDSGAGTLREAAEASGPRVVIFERSGTIVLDSDINIIYPYITIAGQTAPSPGIQIRGNASATVSAGGLLVHAHDVLIQHLRIRPGDGGPVLFSTSGHEATNIYDQGYYTATGGGVYNVVFDHCSLSWGAAKLTTVYAIQNGANISFWQNIFSEALFRAKNVTDDWAAGDRISSIAMALGDRDGVDYHISIIGNLFAHNADRNPELGSGDNVQLINNVIYDWGKDPNFTKAWGTLLYTVNGTNIWTFDGIGNVYIAGPGTGPFTPYYAYGVYSGIDGSKYYLSDTVTDSTANTTTLLDDHAADMYGTPFRVFTPSLPQTGFSILAGSATKASVLLHAGARPANRDTVDSRIITETTNRTATSGASCPSLPDAAARVASIPGRICSQTDVGGWPTFAVNVRALTTPATPDHVNASGYTDLEVWLHGYADGVEF